jgi:hypothetical protein
MTTTFLGRLALMLLSIELKRRVVTTYRRDLLEISCKECAARSRRLVLMHVAHFMRDKSIGRVTFADVDAGPECNAAGERPDEAGLIGDRAEFRMISSGNCFTNWIRTRLGCWTPTATARRVSMMGHYTTVVVRLTDV